MNNLIDFPTSDTYYHGIRQFHGEEPRVVNRPELPIIEDNEIIRLKERLRMADRRISRLQQALKREMELNLELRDKLSKRLVESAPSKKTKPIEILRDHET